MHRLCQFWKTGEEIENAQSSNRPFVWRISLGWLAVVVFALLNANRSNLFLKIILQMPSRLTGCGRRAKRAKCMGAGRQLRCCLNWNYKPGWLSRMCFDMISYEMNLLFIEFWWILFMLRILLCVTASLFLLAFVVSIMSTVNTTVNTTWMEEHLVDLPEECFSGLTWRHFVESFVIDSNWDYVNGCLCKLDRLTMGVCACVCWIECDCSRAGMHGVPQKTRVRYIQ